MVKRLHAQRSFSTGRAGQYRYLEGISYSPRITASNWSHFGHHRADGTVSVTIRGQTAAQQVGRFQHGAVSNTLAGSESGGQKSFSRTTRGRCAVGLWRHDGGANRDKGYGQSNTSRWRRVFKMIGRSADRTEASSRVVQPPDQNVH